MNSATSSPERPTPSALSRRARPYGILIVDDDERVRSFLDPWLRDQGYMVWLAAGGPGAIDIYTNNRDSINLVFLDARMPLMDGAQTLAALLEIDSRVCCCFMSGESGSDSHQRLRELGAAHVLRKPFRPADVARALWELAAPLGSESAMLATGSGMTAGFLAERRDESVRPRRSRSV